ncbi:MAG: archaeosortase/exosortase family protein [Euryarchaeota archaeon]|nr:archaeosortase/exosortase family protein [Euryarchaeota archaeon]
MKADVTKDDLMKLINQNKEVIQFIVLLITFCTVFYILYYHFMDRFAFLENITAYLLGFLLRIFGMDILVDGNTVTIVGHIPLKIIDECTAMFGSIVYLSCVLAYPADIQKKIVGIFLGIPCLYAINMVRLVILAFVLVLSPSTFEFVHTYLWQTIFIIFVILIWLVWVDKVVK